MGSLTAQQMDLFKLENRSNQPRSYKNELSFHHSKPYQRFIYDQLKNSNGNLDHYFNEIISYTRNKKLALRNEQNTWSPVGPFYAPAGVNSNLIPGTGRINTITFHPNDMNIMWLGGGQGGIWKTTNGGSTWFPIGDDLPVLRVSDLTVNPQNTDEIYVCLGDYAYVGYGLELNNRKRNTHYGIGIYKSLDGGNHWFPTGLQLNLQDEDESLMRRLFIHPERDSILLTAGISGIYRSGNKGDNWIKIDNSLIWDIEVDPIHPKVVYATTGFVQTLSKYKSTFMKSEDFGQTWREIKVPGIPEKEVVQRIEIAISPVNPKIVFLVACDIEGGFYGFFKSSDGGESWIMVTDSPNLLHWYDGGSGGGQGTYDLAILTDPVDTNVVYVSGVNNWITKDGGMTWSGTSFWQNRYGPSVHADHHFLAYNPLDQYYYLCHDGGVSRTKEIKAGSWINAYNTDNYQWPTEWEHLNNGLANFAFYRLSIGLEDPNRVLTGAQDMGSFYQNGNQWKYLTLGDGMECIVHPYDTGTIYVSTQYGRIFKSTDGGKNIRSLGKSGRPWIGESAEWTTPYLLLPQDPAKIYVGASNVWYSEDGGEEFMRLSDFANIQSISALTVSNFDPRYIYVAKRLWHSTQIPTQVYMTSDHGKSWQDITSGLPDSIYITYMDVDDDDPLHVYVALAGFTHGEKVYESIDGGLSWNNITLNLPNLPANCIRHQPNSASNIIYVAMDRGIYYKNDLMSDWQLYSEGLPNVIVTELEIHEPSNKLYASTFGRGIWMNNLISDHTTSNKVSQNHLPIKVFPNPTSGSFKLRIEGTLSNNPLRFELIDVMGRKVYQHSKLLLQYTDYHFDLDLPDGLYYARVWQENELSVMPLSIVSK